MLSDHFSDCHLKLIKISAMKLTLGRLGTASQCVLTTAKTSHTLLCSFIRINIEGQRNDDITGLH